MMESGRKGFLLDEVCHKNQALLRDSGRKAMEKLLVFCQSTVSPGGFF